MNVILTGGSGDIGAACARLLAARGADVLIVDSDGGAAELLASEINQGSAGRALARTADVALADDVRGCVATAVDAWGSIDGIVHAAESVAPLTEGSWGALKTRPGFWRCTRPMGFSRESGFSARRA